MFDHRYVLVVYVRMMWDYLATAKQISMQVPTPFRAQESIHPRMAPLIFVCEPVDSRVYHVVYVWRCLTCQEAANTSRLVLWLW